MISEPNIDPNNSIINILSYSIVDIDQNFHCQHLVAEALQELCEKPKQRLRATVDPKSFLKERFFYLSPKKPVAQSARGCGGIGEKSDHPADLVDHPAAKLVLQIISQNWLSSCIWWSTNIFTRLCHAKQRLKLVSSFSPFYGTVSAPAGALYVMVAIMHHQSLLHDQCNNCGAPIALKQLLFNNCTATVSIQQLQQLNYTATISLHQFCCNNGTAYINATANTP